MYMHQSAPRRLDSIIIVVRQFVRVLVAQWRYSPSPWPGQHYFVVGRFNPDSFVAFPWSTSCCLEHRFTSAFRCWAWVVRDLWSLAVSKPFGDLYHPVRQQSTSKLSLA
jgi:hypothetical protein